MEAKFMQSLIQKNIQIISAQKKHIQDNQVIALSLMGNVYELYMQGNEFLRYYINTSFTTTLSIGSMFSDTYHHQYYHNIPWIFNDNLSPLFYILSPKNSYSLPFIKC